MSSHGLRPERNTADWAERRAYRRWELCLPLRYSTQGKNICYGAGVVMNLSNGGMLFRGPHRLPTNTWIDLAIEWPVLKEGIRPLELAVSGSIVRSDKHGNAVKIFRRFLRPL